MVVRPVVHGPSTTVGQLRAYFADDHVHMALVVERGVLLGAVERPDLAQAPGDETLARKVATLDGRTTGPEARIPDLLVEMRDAGRRRLAVIGEGAALLGILCLKESGLGFCSDDDVASRREADHRFR
jgi:CBS-domain-containing membrane protein